MANETIKYRQEDHGTFDEEWLRHRGISGWWYITGYLTDNKNPEQLYSYQFTVIRANMYGFAAWVCQLAITDIQTAQHVFFQRMKMGNKDISIDQNGISFVPFAHLEKAKDHMLLEAKGDNFEYKLKLDNGKGAFWHGDNGVLIMGDPDDPKARTVYYSYPNMPTTGEISFTNEKGEKKNLQVTGKSWFDRQWGPYMLAAKKSAWEWFSLRFFDDEEVMLFAFPQDLFYDGTYIDKNRKTHLVRNYCYSIKEEVVVKGLTFSRGWNLYMPGVKEEVYDIRPLMKGQVNLAYFELIAGIYNKAGKHVGYCILELLPGVRTDGFVNPLDLFKKV